MPKGNWSGLMGAALSINEKNLYRLSLTDKNVMEKVNRDDWFIDPINSWSISSKLDRESGFFAGLTQRDQLENE